MGGEVIDAAGSGEDPAERAAVTGRDEGHDQPVAFDDLDRPIAGPDPEPPSDITLDDKLESLTYRRHGRSM